MPIAPSGAGYVARSAHTCDPESDGMTKLPVQRLAERLSAVRQGPVTCRRCGATLGRARVVLRGGRVQLEGFEGTVRARWTGEDELAFEHVRPGECERR